MADLIELAKQAMTQGDKATAVALLQRHINDNMRDGDALYILANFHLEAGNHGEAYNLFCRVTKLRPDIPHGFIGMGRCLEEQADFEGALECHLRAAEVDQNDYHALHNVGLNLMKLGKTEEAEVWVRRAIDINPDLHHAYETLGMICLKKGDYKQGFELSDITLGLNGRREPEVGERLTGDYPGSVLVYAEQGIGDEVFFSQGLPDFQATRQKHGEPDEDDIFQISVPDFSKVIVECDPRLEGLFRRSFGVETVPRGHEFENWCIPEYRLSIASTMRFHDVKPLPAYLKPDPDRVRMVRALLEPLPRPWVGVAWIGGRHDTQAHDRSMTEEQIVNLIETDGTLISLQYKGATEIVREYPFLTKTNDYDDTAALVACLDHVVSVPTSVVNLAGALGAPTTVLLPDKYKHWRYADGDRSPFFESVSIHRENGEWQSVHIPSCKPLAQTG